MGGCRCTFRGCTKSTAKNPGYHFFHFPVKNKERCEKWIYFSGNDHFREFPEQKLKNQNICEDHFKLAMFMNIKRERLTRFAYPSLLKLISGEVLDLEVNDLYATGITARADISSTDYGNLKCAVYTEETIPRVTYNPVVRNFIQQIPTDADVEDEDLLIEKSEDETKTYEILQEEEIVDEMQPEMMNLVQTATIVQATPQGNIARVIKRKISPGAVTRASSQGGGSIEKVQADIQVLTPVKFKTKRMKPLTTQQIKYVNVEEVTTSPAVIQPQVIVPHGVVVGGGAGAGRVDDGAALAKLTAKYEAQLKQKTAEHQFSFQKQKQEIEAQRKRILELEQIIESKPASPPPAPQSPPKRHVSIQVDMPSTSSSTSSTSKGTETPTKAAPLTKPQLFTSIKRYLSSAMSVMLKMEMFGSSERQWKNDEKQLSAELLNLGEEVYDHFVDEWRLRLPPKSEVSKWQQETLEDEDI